MSEPVIDEWCDRNGLSWEDDGSITDNGERIAYFSHNQNGPIQLEDSGDIIAQGEPFGLKGDWLVIDGHRYVNGVKEDGEYRVIPHFARLEIDGPF